MQKTKPQKPVGVAKLDLADKWAAETPKYGFITPSLAMGIFLCFVSMTLTLLGLTPPKVEVGFLISALMIGSVGAILISANVIRAFYISDRAEYEKKAKRIEEEIHKPATSLGNIPR